MNSKQPSAATQDCVISCGAAARESAGRGVHHTRACQVITYRVGSRHPGPDPFSCISFASFTFPGVPNWIFLLFLPWLPCHSYLVIVEQKLQFCLAILISID